MEAGFLSLLGPFTVLLGVAVLVLLFSERFQMPPVAGLLITGVLVGPHGLGWIGDRATVEQFAELGVLLLLFAIGLELSPDRLRPLQRSFWIGGSVQVVLTAFFAACGLALLGLPGREVAVLAAAATMSSTAVVLKLLQGRGELEAPYGRSSFAILVFQDLFLVPLLVLLPWLAPGDRTKGPALVETGLAFLLAVALVWPLRKLLPRLFAGVARTRIREAFLFASLFGCFGFAYFAQQLGFSAALGAFLAGVVISETDYRWQVVADVEPFRDLFASLFFISIGMLVDVKGIGGHLPLLISLSAATVAIKAVPAFLAVRVSGYPARISWQAALSLAQLGEFSFVVLSSARGLGILSEKHLDLAVDVAVLTLLATPFLISRASSIARILDQRSRSGTEMSSTSAAAEHSDHVVLVGFGLGGHTVARVLREASIRYRIIEANAALVRRAQQEGANAVFGDATRAEILRTAGLARARVLLVAISDFEATCRILHLASSIAPQAHRIVRTRRVAEAERLRAAGAHEVIVEEFESTIEIFSRVLAAYHVPRNVIRAHERVLRGADYELLRLPRGEQAVPTAVLEALVAGTTEVVRLRTGSPAIGHSLQELNLRQETGVEVLAVVREEKALAPPPPDTILSVGDQLVLVGPHEAINRALNVVDPLPSPSDLDDPTRRDSVMR